jgi:hypothetical protein
LYCKKILVIGFKKSISVKEELFMSPRLNPGAKSSAEPSVSKLKEKGSKGGKPLLLSSDTLLGYKVVNEKNEDIGKIEDILFDLNSGSISCLLLSFGGFMGLGNKYFALPFNSMTFDTEKELCILHIHKDRLKNAPGLEPGHLPQIHDSGWLKNVYSYYGT